MDPENEYYQMPPPPSDVQRGFDNVRYSPLGVDDYGCYNDNPQPKPTYDRHIVT